MINCEALLKNKLTYLMGFIKDVGYLRNNVFILSRVVVRKSDPIPFF